MSLNKGYLVYWLRFLDKQKHVGIILKVIPQKYHPKKNNVEYEVCWLTNKFFTYHYTKNEITLC